MSTPNDVVNTRSLWRQVKFGMVFIFAAGILLACLPRSLFVDASGKLPWLATIWPKMEYEFQALQSLGASYSYKHVYSHFVLASTFILFLFRTSLYIIFNRKALLVDKPAVKITTFLMVGGPLFISFLIYFAFIRRDDFMGRIHGSEYALILSGSFYLGIYFFIVSFIGIVVLHVFEKAQEI